MTNSVLHSVFIFFLSALLASCGEKTRDYPYLMSHPEVLEQEVNRCQADQSDSPFCNTVHKAAADFSALVNEHNINPIQFGKQILAAETQFADTTAALEKADAASRDTLTQEWHKQQDALDAMMAVIAITSGLS